MHLHQLVLEEDHALERNSALTQEGGVLKQTLQIVCQHRYEFVDFLIYFRFL